VSLSSSSFLLISRHLSAGVPTWIFTNSVCRDTRAGRHCTDNTTRRLHSLRLAIQLIPKPLDIIQPIRNDNVIARQHALNGRIFFGPSILLGPRSMIDSARQAQRLIVDMVNAQLADAGLGRGVGDLGLEEGLQLQCALGLA